MNFNNVKFYTAAIIYKISTNQTGTYTAHSLLQGFVEAPPKSNIILRGSQTVVQIVSTINFVENCDSSTPQAITPDGSISANTRVCTTDPTSTKIFTQQVVETGGVPSSDYYVSTEVVYSFALQITKGPYFKHIQLHLYYDTGFVAVWVVLFGIGNIAIFQILKGLFESLLSLPKRIKNTPKYIRGVLFGEIPEKDEEGKGGKDEIEMKE